MKGKSKKVKSVRMDQVSAQRASRGWPEADLGGIKEADIYLYVHSSFSNCSKGERPYRRCEEGSVAAKSRL